MVSIELTLLPRGHLKRKETSRKLVMFEYVKILFPVKETWLAQNA